jgi:oxygen-independent coproporphyrinogen-3 oxidase
MLEVDEDSRLGGELLAGGSRYHAHFVPDEDLTADLYLAACDRLEKGGVYQYEISNFARQVTHGIGLRESRHNLKYWTRQPYLGFGVDAHSMLIADESLTRQGIEAVRFATPDSLEEYSSSASETSLGGATLQRCITNQSLATGFSRCVTAEADQYSPSGRIKQLVQSRTLIDGQTALEESFFLGLRMNRGISFSAMTDRFGDEAVHIFDPDVTELTEAGLLNNEANTLRLTPRGRLLSNEVFARFLRERHPASA